MASSNTDLNGSRAEPSELSLIEDRLKELCSRISDDGHAIDAYKTRTAAAVGGGVFLFLLAIEAVYDIITGNNSLWFMLDIALDQLHWVAGALGVASLTLFAMAAARHRRRDRDLEARLAESEEELAELLELKESLSQTGG